MNDKKDKKPENFFKNPVVIFLLLSIVATIILNSLVSMLTTPQRSEIAYSDFVDMLEEDKLEKVIFTGNQIEIYPKKVFNAGVIGMDTVVVLNGEVLQKPSSKQNQREMLKKLSGAYHEVYTGYCLFVLDEKGEITDKICGAEKSRVLFNDLSDKKIEDYIESELGLDKAGGYGIQDEFDLVKSVEGSVFNVIGFPKELFENILNKYDFERN